MNPRTLRRLIAQAVDSHADLVEGYLPEALVAERRLPDVPAALRALHRPDASIDVERHTAFASPAHDRLVLEELFLLELGLAMRRARVARAAGHRDRREPAGVAGRGEGVALSARRRRSGA